jgi:hypothetical protein
MKESPGARSLTLILILMLGNFAAMLSQQNTRCLALLTEVRGEVFVKAARGTEFKKVPWGTQLYVGDVVKTSSNGSASVLLANNNLIELGPGSNITMSENPGNSQVKSKAVYGVESENAVDLSGLTMRATSDGEVVALAGLRGWGTDISIIQLSPRNTGMRSTSPPFAWRCNVQADKFKVTLYDRRGRVWTTETNQTTLDYPKNETPLDRGGKYFWQVEGFGLVESYKSPSIGFSVLSKDDLAIVQDRERRLQKSFLGDTTGASYQFLAGMLYQRLGLFEESITQFEAVAQRHPDAPAVHEVLGKLYNDIGLKDKAIAALQKALKLSQGR